MRSIARAVVRSLVVWFILWLLLQLDASGPHVGDQANVFGFIWTGIKFLGNVLGIAGAAVGAGLEAAVTYLFSAVSWLAARVASILWSTGSIFAKVWDGMRRLWSDVIKPFALFVDRALGRLERWLQRTFGPVFAWLRRVRDLLDHVFVRFLRPVLDLVAFVRQLNRALHIVHIRILDKTTRTLSQLEDKVDDGFFWLYARVNQATNLVNRVVTADGLFAQEALLKSLARDLEHSWSMMFAARSQPLTDDERAAIRQPVRRVTADDIVRDLQRSEPPTDLDGVRRLIARRP